MKVYRSNSDDKPKRKLGKRGILTICISAGLAAAAIAITLILALSGGGATLPPDDITPPVSTKPAFVIPTDTVEIGKEFSNQRLVKFKTSGIWETHEGVDFLLSTGAEIKTISDGTILSIELNGTVDGTVIRIQHAEIVSVYKGLASNVKVKVGDEVKAGDVIGTIGIMPIEKLEYDVPHLHLEVLKDGKRVNPLDYLPEIGDK